MDNQSFTKTVIIQYAAVITAALISAGYGATISWTSPALPYLTSEKRDVPLTVQQFDLISSLSNLGCSFGFIINPYVLKYISKKTTMLLYVIPQVTSWLLLVLSEKELIICIGRFIGGISYAGGLCTMTEYILGVSNFGNRNILFTINTFIMSFGTLMPILYGSCLSYHHMNIALLMTPIVFFGIFLFIPESIFFFAMNRRKEEIIRSFSQESTIEAKKPRQHGFEALAEGGEQGTNGRVSKAGGIGARTNFQFSTEQKKEIDNCDIRIGKRESRSRVDDGKNTKEDGLKTTKDDSVKNTKDSGEETTKDYGSNTIKDDDGKNTKDDGAKTTKDDGSKNTKDDGGKTTKDDDGKNTKNDGAKTTKNDSVINSKNNGGNSTKDVDSKNTKEALTIINIPSGAENTTTSTSNFEKSNQNAPHRRESPFITIINQKKFNIKETNFWKLIAHPNNRRSILIIICLNAADIFSGHYPLTSYTEQFLTHRNAVLPPDKASLLLSFIRLFAILLSTKIVEKIGKRNIILYGGIIGSISLILVAIFFYLHNRNYDISSIGWFPIFFFTLFDVANSISVSNTIFLFQAELFDDNVKSLGISVTSLIYVIMGYLSLVKFQTLLNLLGITVIICFFAVCTILFPVIMFYITPETNGKSVDEIQIELKKITYSKMHLKNLETFQETVHPKKQFKII
ncbi:uncharacterized protein LOC122509949 [Leptopilina heterotoma]|uniref:uncharacterized protein LOC122509949 n=1 Tax=Leptopilina heterotoma TaxID=63436 RepID=UPI001CA881EE|nr:uncharacterized protein LOC122509949 [Leptopilina heterotoma]